MNAIPLLLVANTLCLCALATGVAYVAQTDVSLPPAVPEPATTQALNSTPQKIVSLYEAAVNILSCNLFWAIAAVVVAVVVGVINDRRAKKQIRLAEEANRLAREKSSGDPPAIQPAFTQNGDSHSTNSGSGSQVITETRIQGENVTVIQLPPPNGSDQNEILPAPESAPKLRLVLTNRSAVPGAQGIYSYLYFNEKPRFVGRDAAINALMEMAHAHEPFMWRLLCGPGGTGKSRLAFEVCKRLSGTTLHDTPWRTGFLDLAETQFDFWENWQPQQPHFLVLDYVSNHFALGHDAEPDSKKQRHNFLAIMRLLADRASSQNWQHPVRFLLVEREYLQKNPVSAGDESKLHPMVVWYKEIMAKTDREGLQLATCCHTETPLELTALTDDDLLKIGQEVMDNEAGGDTERKRKPLPDSFTNDLKKVDPKKRALFAIMLASYLAKGLGDSPTRQEVLDHALKLEHRKSWKPANFKTEEYKKLVRATITKTPQNHKPCDSDTAMRWRMINHGLGFIDEVTNDFYLSPLEPDLVGEYFVLEGGGRDSDGKRRVTNPELEAEIAWCWENNPFETGIFFERCSQDFTTHKILVKLFKQIPSEKLATILWRMVAVNYIARLGDAGGLASARAIFDAMADLRDSEKACTLRAMASVNLIVYYGNSSDIDSAWAIFDAMAKLGDSEEIRTLRAKASFNLINAYGNRDELVPARAVFDAMAKLGGSEEIKGLRARAAAVLALAHCKAGQEKETREMQAVLHSLDAGDAGKLFEEFVATLLKNGCPPPDEAKETLI
ncbi:hypothetical protein LJC47_02570 [Desulfosarcina sp. OttesenSCG-928-B08]|nr:hypothetical protein [Desulfosarcina sp. OttesenSCG-928-B08]